MRGKTEEAPFLSVIIPLYNEAENVAPLIEELRETLPRLNLSFEVIAVDDGSKDETFAELKKEAEKHPFLKVIRFTRNYGQTAALDAGMKNAKGEVIVAMDGDLQYDPADIALLIEKYREGYQLVSGIREKRKDKWLLRRLPSYIANWLIRKLTGIRLHDFGCTLKLYSREVVERINLYGEMHRFIPVFAATATDTITEVPVHHRPRTRGKSKYGIDRTLRVLVDFLFLRFFSRHFTKPMHFFGKAGLLFIGLTILLLGIYFPLVFLRKGIVIANFALAFSVGSFILGIALPFLGVLAEILIRIYHQGESYYVIKERINLPQG